MKTVKKNDYIAKYNDDLDGYVFTFNNGKEGAVQYNTVNDVLNADNGEEYLAIYEDGCYDLDEREYNMIYDFIESYKWKDYLKENVFFSKDDFELVVTDKVFDYNLIQEDILSYILENKKNTIWVYQGLFDDDFSFCLEEIELKGGVRTKHLNIVHVEEQNEHTELYDCKTDIFDGMTIAQVLSNLNTNIVIDLSVDIAIKDEKDEKDEKDATIFTYKDGSKLKIEEVVSVCCE